MNKTRSAHCSTGSSEAAARPAQATRNSWSWRRCNTSSVLRSPENPTEPASRKVSGENGTFGSRPRLTFGITRKPEEDTLKKILMIGALAFAASAIAESAVAAEFYVVRDSATKKCTVVDTKPTSTTTTVVDNGTFKTKTEAETGMKTMKVCTN